MSLDQNRCYKAMKARDARFDGRFFIAVKTTGVYCRPICPARTPLRKNCTFVASAAAAQEAGFRPCLRCRPEASPGTPAWLGTSATVSRGLRLITNGALDEGSVDALAERLGIGERQLRRLFQAHLGASPVSIAQNRRILFAKNLIDETQLSITEIAFASGFSSLRRFNDAVRATYQRSPRELRKIRSTKRAEISGSDLILKLPFRPPFHWRSLLEFLALRATPGVEVADKNVYRRTIELGSARGFVEVCSVADANFLEARIRVSEPQALIHAVERLRRVFDLGADPATIASALRSDPRLRKALRSHRGVRVPGAWDGFELAVRAILGQQVSIKGATTLAGRVAAKYGEALNGSLGELPDGLRLIFPKPEVLAQADLTDIGLPKSRAFAIQGLAHAVADNELMLDGASDLEATIESLRALPGIGDWTAHYIAMRALREPDAFPASDLGLRKAFMDAGKPITEKRLLEKSEAWRPWRAYAAVLLWQSSTGDAQ